MGNGNLPPLPMGYKIEEPENEGTPPLPKGYSIEQPVKKKEQTVPSNFGSLAGKYGYTSEEKQQKPIDPTEFAKEYNKNFEQFTGHKELELGSSLPQIAKQREQRKYLKNRAIEETEFKPLLNNVQTGTTSPQQLASLYKKPYGKKIVQDVVEEVMPGASQYGLDPEVFGNEEKWNTIAQNINVKNRPQGVEAQNQYYYNLDNEIYNDLDQLELGNVSVSGGTGGGAANVSSFKLSGVNTNSPEEIGAAISKIESADFVKGKDGQKVEKEPLLKKLNEKLFYLSSQKEIHPDIYALSDKAKEAITRVNMQRERGESISPEEFAKNDQLNQEHFQLGLNFIKDAKPGMYANVSRGLNERGVVSDLDFEQIAGIGQEIYNQKIFREGAVNPEAIGKESKLDYQTYQSKKANYAAILSEEINRLGYKNRAKVPQSAIDKAVARHPELTNVEIINDIRKDEANGGYGVTKGGLLNSFFRGMASPIKGINQTYNALTESPVDNYLNSRRLDYGDQVIADKKGNFRDVLPSERGNIFNEISEGFGQFITQVGLSKGMGKIIQAPYSAAAGSVPRAAMTGAQASNVAAYPGTFLTTAIQTYGSAYTDLLNKTGDPNTAKLGATVNTIGQSAIEAFIMPDVKIADKAKGLLADARAKFADDIVSLVKKGEGKESAKSVIRDFAENSAKIMGGNITEENLQQLTDYTTEALFSPSTIKDRNLGNELWETTKGTVLQMAIPTLLGAGGQSKQQQKFGKDALNTGAINFDEYKDALGKSLINGEIDQQKHDEAIQILGLHKESINNAPKRDAKGEVVSEERQLEYAYQNTVAEVNAQLAANQKDPVQREPFEKKIQEADAVKRKIYYGEEIKGLPKQEEEVAPEVADDDNLLTKITSSENVGIDEKREGLQYFIDKVGEAPIASQRFGEGVVEQLLPRVPTAKLEENYKFLAEIDPEGQDADAIAKELDRRANEANPPIDQQRELDMGDEGLRGEDISEVLKGNGFVQSEKGGLEKKGVRIAIAKDAALGVDSNGDVFNADSNSDNIVLREINVVDEGARGKGNATEVLRDFLKAADEAGKTIFIEPTPIKKYENKNNLTERQLINWYERHGFKKINDQVWKREPGAEIKETESNSDAENRLTYEEAKRYKDAIDKGEVTAEEAAKTIQDMGFIVPKDIQSLSSQPLTEVEGGQTVETTTEVKDGFTEGEDLNKIYAGLKAKYGDKKAATLYEVANRLVNPNKNTIVEIRSNGVVVKEGDKYTLLPFGNTDANHKKWVLYKGLDVTSQFAKPTETIPENESTQEATKATEPKPTIKEPSAKEKSTEDTGGAKEIAKKIRSLKVDLSKMGDGGLQSNPLGLPVAVWNGAMDIIATTVEAGGKVADAIKRGLNYIQKNHRGQWDKKGFNDQVMKELGVRGITVNGQDLVVKDVDKEFAETINGFYSDIEQSVLNVSPNDKGLPQAWLKKIGSGDEAKWTGVADWLNSLPKDQKVSRQEVLQWMKDNRIQVVEVVKGEPQKEIIPLSKIKWEKVDEDSDLYGDYEYVSSDGKYRVAEYSDGTKVLFDSEDVSISKIKSIKEDVEVDKDNTETKFSQYQLEGEKGNYKEVLVTLPYNTAVDKTFKPKFKSSHFDEPNILVHLRMNTRTDAEGNKVLFLEEVQSDWGQKGKKEGFKTGKEKDIYDIAQAIYYVRKSDADADLKKISLANIKKKADEKGVTEKEIQNAFELYGDFTSIPKTYEGAPTAPFVTDTNSWTKLGLKVALKEAVKQGADKIAWSTGEQQNSRYDLSKQVDKIVVQKQPDGRYRVAAWKDSPTAVSDQIVKENEIEGIVGKEIATKAINEGQKEFKGNDLKVGGKGMKGFYGSPTEGSLGIVGNVAKSLFKQEPKTVEVKLSDNLNAPFDITVKDERGNITTHNFDSKSKASAWLSKEVSNGAKYEVISEKSQEETTSTQHSIDITPELKQEAESGLPLFKDIKGRGKEIADLLRKGKIKSSGLQSNIAGIPAALWNAAIDTIATAIEGGATLAQAIQKAIREHKLNSQKGFDQKEFISKLENATGEKLTQDAAKEPPKTPTEGKGVGDEGGRLNDKGILNKLYNAKRTPQAAKEGFKKEGLEYETKSQKEAQEVANALLDEVGIDEAVAAAEAMKFDGDVNSLIFAEALNRLKEQEDKATTPEAKLEAATRFAEVGITYDKMARYGGRFNAAINFFYQKSPLGIVMSENSKRKDDFNQWAKPKDKSWKEFHEDLMKEPEFAEQVKVQVQAELKKERAAAREARIKKVDDFFDKAKEQFKGGAAYSSIIPPKVITTALEGMKQAYRAGEAVGKIIQDAIDYISTELGNQPWDKEKFRNEWEEKLRDSRGKKPLSDEDLKIKVLDKFRKKLKGLSEKQKDEVIRRSHRKLIENGALDYKDLRDIIADVVGRGELTPQDAAKIKELVAKTNEVQKAAEKLREERTDEAFVNFRKAEVEAGKATKELNELFYNKPDIIKRLTSIMQLSTLGIPALINNPIYNLWNQATLRFPVGLINDLVDRGMALAAKAFGKNYEREYNVLETQVEFWEKLGFGAKEAFTQLYSGLNRQDYLQKEVYGQQIRPVKAFRDLIEYTQGKRKLSKTQMMDKAIQSTIGIPAEIVARALNIGDKPQRFAAEGSQASAFAKTLGLQGMDYKLFVEFPREEAYRAYKAQGLSDEVAAEKADYVKEAILKEGQRSTFQQDNILNDVITRAASIFGGKDSGTANLVKTLTISPYIKIPSNAFWSFYNLLNPEVAILQTGIHAGRSKSYGNKGETVKSKLQQREARYWMAHAIVGMAMRAAVIALVKAGVFTPGSDEDDSKKERDAVSYFDKPGSVTIGDVQISNRWFGQWGMMGNAIAKKYRDATPEQRQAQDDFWNVVLGGMEREGLKELQNGIFANTSSILQAVDSGNPDRYLTNTLNMLANIVQPAAIAQINRASLDEVPSSKGDNFLDKLNKNFAQRSVLYRKAFGVQIDSKRDIWGQTTPKGGNILSRLFGISRINPQLFARPIYNDYLETNDSGFLPPYVEAELNGEKLNTRQHDRLQYYIGEERKRLVEPYVNDMAIIEGFNTTYEDIKDPEDKKFVLQYLYNEGRDLGVEKFYQDFPELKKEKPAKDYGAEIKKDLFKILSKYGKRKK